MLYPGDVVDTRTGIVRPLPYAISMMSGTATAYATMAAEIMIVAILYRQGMRLVQCFAFLKNDIFMYLFLII